jgi:hypothetical protein
MSLSATFDPILSRVRLAATALDDGATALFQRSKNGIYWTTVRGGTAVTIDGSDEAALDDYEFVPGALNHYRVTAGSDVFTQTITPSQTDVWFKSITRPFLNRAVSVVDYSDITRPARQGVFEVIGRSLPIVVTDVRGSRRWNVTVKADTVADADALELVFASGDPLYIQVPATGLYSTIPGGYVAVGDMTRKKYGHVSQRRWFDLPMVECAPPGPDVVGATSTWETLIAEFGTWADVLAAFGTWTDVLEYVADPSVVIVP